MPIGSAQAHNSMHVDSARRAADRPRPRHEAPADMETVDRRDEIEEADCGIGRREVHHRLAEIAPVTETQRRAREKKAGVMKLPPDDKLASQKQEAQDPAG